MEEYVGKSEAKNAIRKCCGNCWNLKRYPHGECKEYCGVNESSKAVGAIPKADVIPVEWIAAWPNGKLMVTDVIEDLLSDWRKFNNPETQKNDSVYTFAEDLAKQRGAE